MYRNMKLAVLLLSFGARLKKLRTENNMTQEQLAKKINLSKANVSKYEADIVEPNLETLAMISVLFDVSINYLLDVPDKAAPEEQPLSEKQSQLLNLAADLNEEERVKLLEYAELLKRGRNQ